MADVAHRTYKTERYAVDLSGHPQLVVVYLGMRARSLRGVMTILGRVRPVRKAAEARPDGLLLHEFLIYSLAPFQVGLRQYWRDFASLERWARSGVHARWWQDFLHDPRGTVLLHEVYSREGGMEGLYGDTGGQASGKVHGPFTGRRDGLLAFAPARRARGTMFSARGRLGLEGEGAAEAPLTEAVIYGPTEPDVAKDGNSHRERPGHDVAMAQLLEVEALVAVTEASVRKATSLLRSGPPPNAPTTPGWTLRDTAAHLAGGLAEYRSVLRGDGSPIQRLDDITRRNADMVRTNQVRDCGALAHQIETALDELISMHGRDRTGQLIRWHAGLELPLATVWAVLAAEALVHGYDMATAAGRPWAMDRPGVAMVLMGLLPLLPHYVRSDRAATLRATFDIRLRADGRPRVFFVFEGPRLAVEEPSSRQVDCHISADPGALLLLTYGRIGPLRPALSGRITSWGRRPWLALVLPAVLRQP